jgi:hypothetical protein
VIHDEVVNVEVHGDSEPPIVVRIGRITALHDLDDVSVVVVREFVYAQARRSSFLPLLSLDGVNAAEGMAMRVPACRRVEGEACRTKY